jgi:hypothetical protein
VLNSSKQIEKKQSPSTDRGVEFCNNNKKWARASRAQVTSTASDAPGLLTVHNSTLSNGQFWVGASLIKIQRNSGPRQGAGPGGVRGKIRGFSPASRRRMLDQLSKIDRKELPLFCTLTFPDEFHESINKPKVWKKILKRLEMRFRRKYPGAGGFWRLEMKDRLSGQYVGEWFPHFHLLIYGIDEMEFRKWLAINWWEVCGELSDKHLAAGTSCERKGSVRQVFSYASKYMAKVGGGDLELGRVWGVWAIQNIPFVKALLVVLDEKEAVQLIRLMRRFARLRGRDYRSLKIMCDAEFWWRNLDKLLYPR